MFFSPASFDISFRFAVELVSRPSVKIIKDAGGSVVFAMAFSMESASRVLGWFPCQSSKKETGFNVDLNKISIIEKDGKVENLNKSTKSYIASRIAKKIKNKVSLEFPDKIILIEILGNKTGIAIVKITDILSVEKTKRSMSE